MKVIDQLEGHEDVEELIRVIEKGDPRIVALGSAPHHPHVMISAPESHFSFFKQADGSYVVKRSSFGEPR